MGIRDEEIKRILLYCKGLGIKVKMYKTRNPGFAAHWGHEPLSEIEVFNISKRSKTDLILTLIHEISHHRYYILSGKKPLSEALELENKRKSRHDPVIPKPLRKEIADFEIESLALMTNIAVDLDLKLPMWKVLAAQELDRWMYQVYYETGNEPGMPEQKEKRAILKLKYKAAK